MENNINLKMTGERVVPHDIRTVEEYIQYLRHLFVYEHVKSQITNDDRVLEIGFGEGYGTRMLADICREIIAVDIMRDAVDYANNKYGDDKCKFQWYEGYSLPFEAESFDTVATFQVIEHIQDDNNFASEISRVLKKGGRCFLTTPNRETRLKPGQKPWNRFHVREYSSIQLAELLKKHFDKVDIFGVKAIDEIMQTELSRINPGPILNLLLRLGVRKMIPESLDPLIARFVGMLKGQKKIDENNREFRERFTVENFHLEKDDVPSSLDLFGWCVK